MSKRYIILSVFVVFGLLISIGLIGYGLGKEGIVQAATDDISSYYTEGLNVGYESGYDFGFVKGHDACALELSEAYTVTFNEDWRWFTDGDELFTIEECIEMSIHAANNHAHHAYSLNSNVEHNIYWMNVHNSCAYWLEELSKK